jgi:hypothetical protein
MSPFLFSFSVFSRFLSRHSSSNDPDTVPRNQSSNLFFVFRFFGANLCLVFLNRRVWLQGSEDDEGKFKSPNIKLNESQQRFLLRNMEND